MKEKRQLFKKKNKVQEPELASDAVIFGVGDFRVGDDDSDFEVNVRNADAGIRLLDERKAVGPWYRRELPHEVATSIALMSVIAFLLAAAYLNTSIPLALAGSAVYMLLVVLGERFDVRIKYYTAAAIFVLLAAAVIILRQYIGGGLGNIMNMVYDASEAEQAYIYDRHGTGAADENPELCIRAAVVWASALFGLLGALPGAALRRGIGLTVAAAAMIAFAYYGLIPATFCAVLVVLAVMMVLARGGMLAAVPVLLATLLVFGAIMSVSPGENYAISRADENIRDRLALRSAYLETNVEQQPEPEPDEIEQPEERDPDTDQNEIQRSRVLPIIIAVLVTAVIAAAIYLMYRRYARRRDANRVGIDSPDIRTAIIAMFPYAVRWLGAADIEVEDKSFASLLEPIAEKISEQYAAYYGSMYAIWREAAYSDHELDEEKKSLMQEFVDDTRKLVQSDMSARTKLRTALKYAL